MEVLTYSDIEHRVSGAKSNACSYGVCDALSDHCVFDYSMNDNWQLRSLLNREPRRSKNGEI
jgi:hypothetical protein